jgi:hypothetical protein
MSTIYHANHSFAFDKLVLSKPIPIAGGSHFIRCAINNEPLYIQPPSCCTKQGILKAGKRFYTDMMFSNTNAEFIQWMEKLEEHCQRLLYENRVSWFDGEMEKHDIENYFTSPLKIFKSGKYYLARVNVPSILGKLSIKIYDEDENELEMECIDETTTIMTILEIKGIKCSSTCFQLEMDIKQLLVMKPKNVFEKCLLKPSVADISATKTLEVSKVSERSEPAYIKQNAYIEPVEPLNMKETSLEKAVVQETLMMTPAMDSVDTVKTLEKVETVIEPATTLVQKIESPMSNPEKITPAVITEPMGSSNELEEIEVHLDDLPMDNNIVIKKRNDVYYQMYYEARQKAKRARDLALSSYLEAKRIKNTYMLDEIHSSDDSESEVESDSNE